MELKEEMMVSDEAKISQNAEKCKGWAGENGKN
jgi:hypothetical protein